MTNAQTAITICQMADHFYNRLFNFRGFAYYNPVMSGMQKQAVHGDAAMVHDNFLAAPNDIRVSCQTDTILPRSAGGLEPARMLKLEPIGDIIEVSNCNWRCMAQIADSAKTVGDVRALFNQKIANSFKINLGAYMDLSIRDLMLSDIPTVSGTTISAAKDGIKTVTVDSLIALEPTLRQAISKQILSNSFEEIGDIIIYCDKDLQAAMTNGFVMGQNAFGGCSLSEFDSNITRCPGSVGVRTLAYTTPLTELPSKNGAQSKFFPEEGGYRTYFVVASARAIFGYDPDYVQTKMDDPCGVSVPYSPQFMEKFVGCEYIAGYHEVFDKVMGESWFYIKENKNPVHKKNLIAEYELGGVGGFSRRPNLGFLLKVKVDMFDKYITNTQLTTKDFAAVTTVTPADAPIPAEYINDEDPKNAKVTATNKKV